MEHNAYVLNNMDIGHISMDGKFTFHKGGRKSQNDICLTNKCGLNNVSSFDIHEIGWNISDHFPVTVSCRFISENRSSAVEASSDIIDDLNEKVKIPNRIIGDNTTNWNNYRVIAKNELEMLENDVVALLEDPNSINLDVMSNSLYNSAKTCCTKRNERNEFINEVDRTDDIFNEANEVFQRYSSDIIK